MRHGTTNRRQRSRGNSGRRGNQPRMQVYDSNGPDVRIRGTAHQVAEKYMALAKDASSAGDIILSQSYLQHAEHYQRIINSWEKQDGAQAAEPAPGRDEPKRDNSRNRTGERKFNKKKEVEDDLALPSSILGDVSKPSSDDKSSERTEELSTT